ncbi:hypothetical protein ACFQL7_27935 [Halocatena marina]|uniref:Uncharacterized protein n=1 Tax=Halocatena marina TaxID=2934937 RepID=A0ABD5YXT4_9EURY
MSFGADDTMLPTASWFHAADRSLLRFYGEHSNGPFFCPPGAAGLNVSISKDHARRRAKVLTVAGLLERQGTNYRITDLGLRYVRGEMNQDDLEALAPNTDE